MGQWDSQMWMVAAGAALIGAVFGMLAAWLGEFQSQIFHQRGNTHIDPPAMSIWVGTTIVLALGQLLS